jgi:hypothetical protein
MWFVCVRVRACECVGGEYGWRVWVGMYVGVFRWVRWCMRWEWGERGSVWVCVGCEWVEVGGGAKLHEYVSVGLFVFSRVCVFMCNVHMLK